MNQNKKITSASRSQPPASLKIPQTFKEADIARQQYSAWLLQRRQTPEHPTPVSYRLCRLTWFSKTHLIETVFKDAVDGDCLQGNYQLRLFPYRNPLKLFSPRLSTRLSYKKPSSQNVFKETVNPKYAQGRRQLRRLSNKPSIWPVFKKPSMQTILKTANNYVCLEGRRQLRLFHKDVNWNCLQRRRQPRLSATEPSSQTIVKYAVN